MQHARGDNTVDLAIRSPHSTLTCNSALRAAWSFDYSVITGLNGATTDLSDFTFELSVDVDPSSSTDYQVFTMAPGGAGRADVTWTNQLGDTVDDDQGIAGMIAQNSRNLAFYDTDHGTAGTQPYDPAFGPGQFDIILRAYQGGPSCWHRITCWWTSCRIERQHPHRFRKARRVRRAFFLSGPGRIALRQGALQTNFRLVEVLVPAAGFEPATP